MKVKEAGRKKTTIFFFLIQDRSTSRDYPVKIKMLAEEDKTSEKVQKVKRNRATCGHWI